MTTAVQDKIERVMVLPVPRERAWAAITEPDQIARWFPDSCELELKPGGAIKFAWGAEVVRARVDAVEPPRRFAWRWVPGANNDSNHSIPFDEKATTLVEFVLDEIPEGTRLTLIETGFASLPPEIYEQALKDNEEGWTSELAKLVPYLTG